MWQPQPNVKKVFIGRTSKERSLEGFDHYFFHRHALFVGCNVTNTLYNTIKAENGVWGVPTALKNTLRKLIQCNQKKSLVEGLQGSIFLNVSG